MGAHPVDASLPDNEKISLSVNGSDRRGYFRPALQPTAYGGVLLVADTGHHPATLGTINTLRITLSEQHWLTLALPGDDNNTLPDEAFISAGIQYLNQQPVDQVVLLGEGSSATHLLQTAAALSDTVLQQIAAIVLINANTRFAGISRETLSRLNDSGVKILDAYSDHSFQQQQGARLRRQAAKRANNRLYQQVRLPRIGPLLSEENNRVSQRIRGWLDKHIAGIEPGAK